MIDIPAELAAARETVGTVFAAAHEVNDAHGHNKPALRMLVEQTSAALTAINRAIVHAGVAFKESES